MANLLKETLEVLDNLGIKEEDVIYVVDRENPKDCKFMTWEMFKDISRYKTYDEGLGIVEVNTDIIIYTVDYILYRHEYDGAERWEEIPTPEHMHELLSGKSPEIFSIDGHDFY